MKGITVLMLVLLPAATVCRDLGAAGTGPQAAPAPDYQVGERLRPKRTAPPRTAVRFRQITWDDLVPPSWNPSKLFRDLDIGNLRDSDPRAMRALERLREEWKKAPVNPALNGAAVRIPGFLVPLEMSGRAVAEFLLVPYFGACIHAPPPPANQIIHVFARTPFAGESMAAVWASGVLETTRSATWMGESGYRMDAIHVEPYREGG